MVLKQIESWHVSPATHYVVRQASDEIINVDTTLGIATNILAELLIEGQRHGGTLTKLWNCGKVKAAEHAKPILDAAMAGIVSPPIAAILLAALSYQSTIGVGWVLYGFNTERLLGKRRLEFFEALRRKYFVHFVEPQFFALMALYENRDKKLLAFMEEHKKEIDSAIREGGY